MVKRITRSVRFSVQGQHYEIQFFNDYEVMLKRTDPPLDHMRTPVDEYNRIPTDPAVAVVVYRRVVKEVQQWIYETRPPMIKWTAGLDPSRIKLYERLGRLCRNLHYRLERNALNPNFFVAFRV